MLGSVDSISLVRSFPKLTNQDLKGFGFTRSRDKKGSWKWFNNGLPGKNEPRLTFYKTYKTWQKLFRLRVDFNIPKILFGSNIQLPNKAEIKKALELVSNNIMFRTGLWFDTHTAETCRIHYAFNQKLENVLESSIVSQFEKLNVPRLKRTSYEGETVYFSNKSRSIRIYDKNREVCKKEKCPELIKQSSGIIRYEYAFDDLTSVKRFSKRMGFKSHKARIMLSENSINVAILELQSLLNFGNISLPDQSKLNIVFEKTKDGKKSINLFGFLGAFEEWGRDFYKNPIYKMSKATYYRQLNECQELGLIPLG